MKFILFITVKMPTIVGILTFISMINTSLDSLRARKVIIFKHFCLYEQLKFYAQLSQACKKCYNLEASSGEILSFSRLYSSVNLTHEYSSRIAVRVQAPIKLFSCSTQLSTKFILLIIVKMPTIVGILTFIIMINISLDSLKARSLYFSAFLFL